MWYDPVMKMRFRFEDIAEKEYPVVKKDILSLLLLMVFIAGIVSAIYIIDSKFNILNKYSSIIVEKFIQV